MFPHKGSPLGRISIEASSTGSGEFIFFSKISIRFGTEFRRVFALIGKYQRISFSLNIRNRTGSRKVLNPMKPRMESAVFLMRRAKNKPKTM
jgi:hypothetical protein